MITLKGHKDALTSVAFPADGNSLATSGREGSLRLWRAAEKPGSSQSREADLQSIVSVMSTSPRPARRQAAREKNVNLTHSVRALTLPLNDAISGHITFGLRSAPLSVASAPLESKHQRKAV